MTIKLVGSAHALHVAATCTMKKNTLKCTVSNVQFTPSLSHLRLSRRKCLDLLSLGQIICVLLEWGLAELGVRPEIRCEVGEGVRDGIKCCLGYRGKSNILIT